jgi:hypothetical protein
MIYIDPPADRRFAGGSIPTSEDVPILTEAGMDFTIASACPAEIRHPV